MSDSESHGGCNVHGPFQVCGHTTETCPDAAKLKMQKTESGKDDTDVGLRKREIIRAVAQERDFGVALQKFYSLFEDAGDIESLDETLIEKLKGAVRSLSSLVSELSSQHNDEIDFKKLSASVEARGQELKSLLNRRTIEVGGKILGDIWKVALTEYPELHQVDVKSGKPEAGKVLSHTGGYFADPSDFDSIPTIYIVPGDDEHYEKLLTTRKKSVEIVAGLLGIEPEKVTVKILQSFIFAHELGHAYDFITNYKNNKDIKIPPGQAWQDKSSVDSASLPIPNVNISKLNRMIEDGTIEKIIMDDSTLREKYFFDGMVDIERLREDYDIRHRALSKEQYADRFAADVLKRHSEFLSD